RRRLSRRGGLGTRRSVGVHSALRKRPNPDLRRPPTVIRFSPLASQRSLSVVIPAYCERENILQTLDNGTRALEPLDRAHEILVVEDGSTDDTGALITSNLGRFPTVRLLVNERNIGFGCSYRRGVDAAALDHIVMVHGDNAWGWDTLREFFSHVGDADVIIGYTRQMSRSRTWRRTIVSKTFTLLLNLITRRR